MKINFKLTKKKGFLFAIVLLQILVFWQSLNFFFISDDFYFLNTVSFKEALLPRVGFYHYNPVFWISILFLKTFFNTNALWYHTTATVIHLLNSVLVFVFAKEVLKETKKALLTTLLFAVFFAQYEVVFWITGLNTSLMVCLGLLSFLFYREYEKRKNQRTVGIAIILSLIAVLIHEYGIVFILGIFAYQLVLEKKNIYGVVKNPYTLTILGILVIALIRSFQWNSEIVPSQNTPIYIMWYAAKLIAYLGIPNPYIIDNVPKYAVGLLSILVAFSLYKLQRNNNRIKFLTLWIIAELVVISTTSAPQARYLYFMSIPAMMIVVEIMKNKDKFLQFFVYGFIVFSGITFIQNQIFFWSETSKITRNTIEKIYNTDPKMQDNIVYAVNFPDSINGPPWNAYLFRNGLDSALTNMYGKKIEVIYYRTVPLNKIIRNDKTNTMKNIMKEAKNKKRVFQFNYKTNTIDTVQ